MHHAPIDAVPVRQLPELRARLGAFALVCGVAGAPVAMSAESGWAGAVGVMGVCATAAFAWALLRYDPPNVTEEHRSIR
jgi:hypothetical protein